MYEFPDTYLVVDIETDGLRPAHDNILQVGYLLCINGEVTQNGAVYVATPEDVLMAYDNGNYVRKQKAAGNDGYVKTAAVREFGLARYQVFKTLKGLYEAVMGNANAVVVGHNLCAFDVPFIEYFSKKIGCPVEFDRKRIIDTGAFIKANQLGLVPDEMEDRWEFFTRVKNLIAKGVFWNLAFSAKHMKVVDRLPFSLEAAHDAAADCMITHHVYQAIRERMANAEP